MAWLIASMGLAAAALCGCKGSDANLRTVLQAGPVQPRRVAFSPRDAGRVLVVERSGVVSLWTLGDRQRPLETATLFAAAVDASFLPDGDGFVTGGPDGAVRWWDEGGQLLQTSALRHPGTVRAIAAGRDLLLSGGDGGEIYVWRPDGSPAGDPVRADSRAILSLSVSTGGVVASLGLDQTVRLWRRSGASTLEEVVSVPVVNPRLSPLLEHLVELDENWGWGRSLDFTPDGQVLAGAVFDGSVRLWDSSGRSQASPLRGHEPNHVRSVAFSATGDLLASAGHDGRVRLWQRDGAPRPGRIVAHSGAAYSVDIAPTGDRLVTTGADDYVRFWDLDGTKVGEIPPAQPSRITSIEFSPSGEILVAGDASGTVRLWNLDGSPRAQPIRAHRGGVTVVAFNPSGAMFATGGKDQTVRLWNLDGSPYAEPFRKHIDAVDALVFSPSGQLLASTSRGESIRLWDLEGRQRSTLHGLRDIVGTIAFSPDGELVAAGSAPHEIEIWEVGGAKKTPPVVAHQGHVFAVAFSPRGDSLATAGRDGLVRLWNLQGKPRGEPLAVHRGSVRSLAFSADGSFLASGGVDGEMRVWDRSSGELKSIQVGVPIEQIGVCPSFLWVRARSNVIRFYDLGFRLTATMILSPQESLVFTTDGWYGGHAFAAQDIALFDGSRRLDEGDAAERRSPRRVVAAILGEH